MTATNENSFDIPHTNDFMDHVDRFFSKHIYSYKETPASESQDHLVLVHSNGICLIQLAKTHPAFQKGIESINFDIGNFDRSKNEVKGKGKKGGMALQEQSLIAIIRCKDGTTYNVVGCIPGKLVEVNALLSSDLELLRMEGYGYIAVVLPKPNILAEYKTKLKTL